MKSLIYSILTAFIISSILAPIFIPFLHRLKFGQNIREDGPASHRIKKGTPTLGGFIFIIATLIAFLIFREIDGEAIIVFVAFLGFGLIGFLDDILKIRHKDNLGLRVYEKMILLLILSGFLAWASNGYLNVGTDLIIPFLHKSINLGLWYIPFIIFFYVAVTNSVNLTDGLDGLSTSVTLLIMTFLSIVSYATGHNMLALFCSVLAGALLGFLRVNVYPAKIFMGDMGSLALGGAVASVAVLLKLPLLVIIIGGIYLIETLSVIIQVISFKLTGKRVFRMSPIHHHFELLGWHETRVVAIFSIVTVLLCLLGFLSLAVFN
ncbi:MAG TPA: phospho-N-acetylmuramoyl-pentapeptide-transferase [Clostridiaceae bacterium]